MIIWVYGEDTFCSRQKLKELVTSFKDKFDPGGLNLLFFKEKASRDEIFQAATAAPFMSPKKMIVVENLTNDIKKKEWQELIPLWKRVPEETILVIWEEGKPRDLDSAFESMPKKDVHYYEFPTLSFNDLKRWLASRISQKKIKMPPGIQNRLIQKVGQDTWRLDSELDKLRARAGGGEIISEHIDELVDTRLEDNIFLFCDFLAGRNPGKAVSVLEGLLAAGFNEAELISKLAWQLKIMLKLRSYLNDNPGANINQAAKEIKIHPYAAQKINNSLDKFDFRQIKSIYQKALDLDVGLKSGRTNPRLGLEMIVANI